MRLVVIGAGFSGLGAILSARALDAEAPLVVVRGRAGASALSSGAYDLEGWNVRSGDRASVPSIVAELLSSARAPIVVEDALVVSEAGVLRPSRGRDVQVLAVPVDRVVGVPRIAVGNWDADAIASSLDEALRARGGKGARALDAMLLRHRDEARLPLGDFAALHDDDARVGWLIARLRETLAAANDVEALLLPPICGIAASAIERIRKELALPIGEALAAPGGPACLRFARWSTRALEGARVELIDGEAQHVSAAAVRVRLEGDGGTRAVGADRVILAVGGVDAGGLVFGTREHELGTELPAADAIAPLRLSFTIARASHEAPVVAWLDDAAIEPAGSGFGLDGDRFLRGSPPPLVRAGLPIDEGGRVLDRSGKPVPFLFAAGDVVAARPRTMLEAFAAGAHAARAALVDSTR